MNRRKRKHQLKAVKKKEISGIQGTERYRDRSHQGTRVGTRVSEVGLDRSNTGDTVAAHTDGEKDAIFTHGMYST